jgi:hypothetical protein
MVTVLASVGGVILFQPPLTPRASPTAIGATSVVDVPTATQVVVVQPTDVSGIEILLAGTPETSGSGATTAVPHDAKISEAMAPVTLTRTKERTLVGTRLMVSLSSVRRLSLR